MRRKAFRVWFNKRKQYYDVFIADNSRKFLYAEKCYAYYQPETVRKARRGKFGEVHFSQTGAGLVSHELLHLLIDWMRVRNMTITPDNEERIVSMYGELVRRFWIKYYAWEKRTTL